MESVELDDNERGQIEQVVRAASERFSSANDPGLLLDAPVLAHELPTRVRHLLNRFRRQELGACIVAGHQVDGEGIGATPEHWSQRREAPATLALDLLLVLYGALLGDAFGWSTQQDGRLIHDVFPIKSHEDEQLGTGSKTLLTWHTEDAFHPYRPDYVVLACLRNPSHAATTVGNIDDLRLSAEETDTLFEERFIILPDQSHLARNNTRADIDFGRIEELSAEPPRVSVLFGSRDRPYIRADPYFMQVDDDERAARALARLVAEMDANIRDVVLRPGEFCFLDNYKVVHGRRPFEARYDGTDRWLKRACITRDLRKSREARTSALSQVIA
jgi:Fe(II)/alpha-ketoglutarate-dependent arginine beta-hydroxylase